MPMTERQAMQWSERLGLDLEWVEVTVHGDRERMVLITTPSCEYCGMPNPTGHCRSCGASVLRDGAWC